MSSLGGASNFWKSLIYPGDNSLLLMIRLASLKMLRYNCKSCTQDHHVRQMLQTTAGWPPTVMSASCIGFLIPSPIREIKSYYPIHHSNDVVVAFPTFHEHFGDSQKIVGSCETQNSYAPGQGIQHARPLSHLCPFSYPFLIVS